MRNGGNVKLFREYGVLVNSRWFHDEEKSIHQARTRNGQNTENLIGLAYRDTRVKFVSQRLNLGKSWIVEQTSDGYKDVEHTVPENPRKKGGTERRAHRVFGHLGLYSGTLVQEWSFCV